MKLQRRYKRPATTSGDLAVIVLDASALLHVLIERPVDEALMNRIAGAGELHTPHLIDVEIVSALRRLNRRGLVSDEGARVVLDDVADLPLRRYPHELLRARMWGLRHNITASDATYIALAESLDLPLVTTDHRLAGSSGHRAVVESYVVE